MNFQPMQFVFVLFPQKSYVFGTFPSLLSKCISLFNVRICLKSIFYAFMEVFFSSGLFWLEKCLGVILNIILTHLKFYIIVLPIPIDLFLLVPH